MSIYRCILTTVCLVLFIVFLSSLPQTGAQQDSDAQADKTSVATLFEDSRRIAQQIDIVGPKLIEVLDDQTASITDRLQAATLLGHLNYRPGIPVLIKHVGLFDKFKITRDEGPDYDCMLSLVKYGEAAVPAVVDAFLATSPDDQTQEYLLKSIVSTGKLGKIALPYCKGRAPEKPNPAFDRKLTDLKKYIGIK